jgi:hypothetical protein
MAMTIARRRSIRAAPKRLLRAFYEAVSMVVSPSVPPRHPIKVAKTASSPSRQPAAPSASAAEASGSAADAAATARTGASGATAVSAAAGTVLQDAAASREVAAAAAQGGRALNRLVLKFHQHLTAVLAKAKSTARLLRRASRIATAETRAVPRAWLVQMVGHCEAVARYAAPLLRCLVSVWAGGGGEGGAMDLTRCTSQCEIWTHSCCE